MISLWKTANDLDRLHDLQRATLECYAQAIASMAQYAVAPDQARAAEFRVSLQALEKQLRDSESIDTIQAVETALRGQLRDYQEHAHSRLDQLHQEVIGAAKAMKLFAESVSSNGADHEKQMEQELKHLDVLTTYEDIGEIRHGLQDARSNLAASFEQLRRSNQLVIAQLQDEIRLLHQAIQSERRALFTDRSSGTWNHQKMAERMEELMRQDDPFCLLMVRLRNLKRMEGRYSRIVIEGALKAVLTRFQNLAGEDAMLGRWSEDEFVAILPMEPTNALTLSREVTRKLSGSYAVQENGVAQNIVLQVTSGIVERSVREVPAKFHKKVAQLTETMTQVHSS
ncbi:MAG: GGDEF domain-containing protein [Bryobacteraceae bacterium]